MSIDEKRAVVTVCCVCVEQLFKTKLTKLTSKHGFEEKVVDTVLREADVPKEQNLRESRFLTQASNFYIQLFSGFL